MSQSTGFSELAAADSAQCSADLNLQDRRLLPQCFADIQTLSGKSFTLDAASNSSGDNAHCSTFYCPTNSFLSKLHTGHIWINAPFTALHEFLEHYVACKEASPTTTACILVPQFLLPALRPLLKGMSIIKKYAKNTVMFDAPTKSANRRTVTGVHWPVYVFSDAVTMHLLFLSTMVRSVILCMMPLSISNVMPLVYL